MAPAADDDAAPEDDRMDPELERLCVQNLLENSPEAVFFKDLESRFILVSSAQAQRLGVSDPAEALGRTDSSFFSAEHAERTRADELEIIRTGEPMLGMAEALTTATGQQLWLSVWKAPLRDPSGQIIGTYGVAHDISERVEAERLLADRARELARTNARLARVQDELRALLAGSPDAICRMDASFRFVYVNAAAQQMLGVDETRAMGRTGSELGLPDAVSGPLEDAVRASILTGQEQEAELTWDTGLGASWYAARVVPEHGSDGTLSGAIVAIRDYTERHEENRALAHRATHDALTGLANRGTLAEELEEALSERSSPGLVVLLFIDLNRFKNVNDTYGHATGDLVLQEAARRLRSHSRDGDVIARLGGDEFVMLCRGVVDQSRADELAARVRSQLAEPYWCQGQLIQVGASVGLAAALPGTESAAQLLDRADATMYREKNAPRVNRLRDRRSSASHVGRHRLVSG